MNNLQFICFNNNASKTVTNHILSGQTYRKIDFVKDIRTIVDIGANIGASSVYFSRIYPEAQIFGFEPAKDPYSLLEKNVASYKNIKIHNIGLFSEDKTVPLYKSKIDCVTGSIGKSFLNTEITEEIILKDAKSFLKGLDIEQIDILKIDTEGCEIPVLKSIKDEYLSNIKIIYLEYHSEEDRLFMDKMLTDNNYILYCGSIACPHRGEFCYVNKSIPESEKHLDEHKIII